LLRDTKKIEGDLKVLVIADLKEFEYIFLLLCHDLLHLFDCPNLTKVLDEFFKMCSLPFQRSTTNDRKSISKTFDFWFFFDFSRHANIYSTSSRRRRKKIVLKKENERKAETFEGLPLDQLGVALLSRGD
jgi:hypothetical protein